MNKNIVMKKMMMQRNKFKKVYCSNCKYLDSYRDGTLICKKHIHSIEGTSNNPPKYYYGQPIFNTDNDCKYYRRQWVWLRLGRRKLFD